MPIWLTDLDKKINIFWPSWPIDPDKYIPTDLADGIKQVNSHRFDQRIWTIILLPIWLMDFDKYIMTDLADGYGQINSDRFCR